MTARHGKTESDVRLVDRSLNGDRKAFARLYDRYARLIRALAFDATRNLPNSQDITQETFLRAWRDLSALRDRARFCPWLIGISKQVCREYRRANLRFPQEDGDTLSAAEENNTDGDHDLLARERDQFVLEAVSRLPEKERLAVHLFYLRQQDAAKTAEVLELSRSGMYALLKRALKELAQRLKPIAPEKEGST